ncbi:ABC-type proline/glycine betaine transport system, periplasmic component [Shewanella psychrophila]|uniref:ABC-type proline/glycine betaine transport system, periplasmic component n=1 Tax=Shewanella psychrophila TaxID=225848 RepID=A0A1S6HN26_9GAMM|nr:glycine betaine ABC transporter substrate-binding protein [Shewanella psychrophila]AQS36902.1 ABC-type proline/glycine betaine transport system, periplasmic component [Shewanella psychrophila]
MSNKITIGVTDLSFHHVAASLVYNVLSEMGFEVERIYSPHQDNFAKLKSGEIDMLSSAWLPSSHGIYKSDVEAAQPLLELGLHYQPYALWGVPDYVPEEVVSQVSDLVKPDVIVRMNKNIQGINPGAGITRFSIKMMDEYALKGAGYSFNTGSEEDCFGAFETAVNNKEWIIVPLWKPQFLHHSYQIREISEPKGLLGIVDRAVLLLRQDRVSLFTQAQLDRLDALRFSNEIIAALDYQVSREGMPIDAVTRAWLNQSPY